MSQAAIECPCGLRVTMTGLGRRSQMIAALLYEDHRCPAQVEEHEVETQTKIGFQPNPVEYEEDEDDED